MPGLTKGLVSRKPIKFIYYCKLTRFPIVRILNIEFSVLFAEVIECCGKTLSLKYAYIYNIFQNCYLAALYLIIREIKCMY